MLSGGSARGLAHIGVIEEFMKSGHTITSIAGTSMGAVVVVVYALGKMPEFKTWMCSLDKRKVFSLVDFNFGTSGLIKGDKVINKMKEFIDDQLIEDLPIPFAAVATDLLNKKEVVFTKGSIYDAIRASIAIPTVIAPVKTTDGLLVDGGLLNNAPVNHVFRTNDDLLVLSDVNANVSVIKTHVSAVKRKQSETEYKSKVRRFYDQLGKLSPHSKEESMGYFTLMDKTINLLIQRMSELAVAQSPPDLNVKISVDTCNTFDFYKAEELIEAGRKSARKVLKNYHQLS